MSASPAPRPNPKPRPLMRKRSLGVVPSSSETSSDPTLDCPICYSLIQDAYMTRCGHSFCHDCVKRCIEKRPACPLCSCELVDKDGKEQIFPNRLLNDLALRAIKSEKRPRIGGAELGSRIMQILAGEKDVSVNDVNQALDVLQTKKRQIEATSREVQLTLLREFLDHSYKAKHEELNRIKTDIALLEQDLSFLDSLSNTAVDWHFSDTNLPHSSHSSQSTPIKSGLSVRVGDTTEDGAATSVQTVLSQRRFRMHAHFQCLEDCYFSARQIHREEDSMSPEPQQPADASEDVDITVRMPRPRAPRGLERFAESLSKFTRYSQLRSLSTLNYASDLLNSTSIVSSIEFDKDSEYFAIAGVTKRIKMFEYSTVIRNDVDMHYPINEMTCSSKISCISWSSYHKNMLGCSDYEGTVTLWDAYRSQKVKTFQEHEKRCWSVDFNKVDTKILASGSDDTKVKLWAINQEHSISSIEAKANVCCVRFNPDSMYHLAMGSADHCVHYYDLRNCKTSLGVFKGHKKAVSYVKFLNAKELVSASTDSQLKLWKTDDPQCLRSFTGHVNEKNFVGLATDGDYIACGSENNSLYIYYKGLSTQIQTWSFRTQGSGREDGTVPVAPGESNEFVSAVCWMTGSAVVVAANSQGTIKLLELV
ncbi:ubiquitin-protein ligase E3B-like [Tropilaelaps mercedesae]|uniref:Ubiquitin-protein ligase E3B-like n=1 Tax=Tropilaelaps mercedesae TaxID=418985 RepID=A0A1V9XYE5_9ACAR|nr:ubiquitin-protein ligase E3B-like [Tropilaelaps mercedesae]